MASRATITSSTLRARDVEEKSQIAAAMADRLIPALANGDIIIPVVARYGLDQAEAAYGRFVEGAKFGKIILQV